MLVELSTPPGIRAVGTQRGSRGYFRDSSLIRWNPDLQPVGGWERKSETAVDGKGRAMLAWRDDTGLTWTAIGTHTGLWVMTPSGTLHDITPPDFTPGLPDAETGGGFGVGAFGEGDFGTPREDSNTITPASVWTLDLWNDRLVGCMADDGRLLQWDLDPSFPAEPITGAPTGCTGLVVTEDKILMAFRGRQAVWCDQGDNTVWESTELNQAGDLGLATDGLLLCGRKVRGRTLVFTTSDVWEAVYQNAAVVYGFQRAADSCGPVSLGSPVTYGTGLVAWMGSDTFYQYGGYVRPIPCDVEDRVFSDLNKSQASKVVGWHNPRFGEVWWHYPSADSDENNRYVCWDYRNNLWTIGALARTAGTEKADSVYPLLVSPDGVVFLHEKGGAYDDALPFAQTGPFEWPQCGEDRVLLTSLIPDEKTRGQSQFRIYTTEFPGNAPVSYGPYTIDGAPVYFLLSGRGIEVKVEFLTPDARWGTPRVDAEPISKR